KRYSSNLAFLGTMVVRVLLVRLSPGRRTIGTPPEPSLLRSTGAVVVPLPPIRTAEEASAFCRLHEPTSEGQLVVLDLSIRSWLNSLELGVVARLARAAHRRGGALFLTGVTGRARRLIRLFRLERYVEVPDSPECWAHRLGELATPRAARATRWGSEGGVLQI